MRFQTILGKRVTRVEWNVVGCLESQGGSKRGKKGESLSLAPDTGNKTEGDSFRESRETRVTAQNVGIETEEQ